MWSLCERYDGNNNSKHYGGVFVVYRTLKKTTFMLTLWCVWSFMYIMTFCLQKIVHPSRTVGQAAATELQCSFVVFIGSGYRQHCKNWALYANIRLNKHRNLKKRMNSASHMLYILYELFFTSLLFHYLTSTYFRHVERLLDKTKFLKYVASLMLGRYK